MQRRQVYLDRLEQRKLAMLSTGLLADRYPGVASIAVHLTYYQRTGVPVLMTRTVNYYPGTCAYFQLDCMREECVSGGFDLSPVVAGLIRDRKRSGKGTLSCHGKAPALRSGHASISYEVCVAYSRQART